jgi:hypothetical protein
MTRKEFLRFSIAGLPPVAASFPLAGLQQLGTTPPLQEDLSALMSRGTAIRSRCRVGI